MARIIKKRPSPAMILAIIATVLATAGTSYAISGGLKNTFGTGPLVYSTNNSFIPAGAVVSVGVSCPPKLHPVGGGIRLSTGSQAIEGTVDSFPTRNGWRGTVANFTPSGGPSAESHTAFVTAICAKSPQIRGTVAGF
jgi:hypothetical protein